MHNTILGVQPFGKLSNRYSLRRGVATDKEK
jgi:hypothetical protein